MGGGRSMDSLISPKGNQKKDMQYEQTHKIFLCSFGEYLMHIRSGLCNVNFRVMGKKAIILKTNVAVSEKKLWFTERGCSNTPGLKWFPATSRWPGRREEECSFQDAFCIQLKLQEPELSCSPSVKTSCSVQVRYSPYSSCVGLEPRGSSARTGALLLSRGRHLGGESWQTQCKCRCCRCLWWKRPDTAPTPPISTTGGASGFSPILSTSSLHRPRFCSWEECETRTPFFHTGSKASSHPIRTRALPGSASLVSSEVTSSVFDSLSPPLHFHTDLLLSVLPLLSHVFSVGPFFTFWGYKIRQHFHIK